MCGIAARDGRRQRPARSPLSRGQRGRNSSPGPGAAEVEPVEMRDLAVAAVADGGGVNRVAGSRRAMRGRKAANQSAKAAASRQRFITAPRSARARGIRRPRLPRLAVVVVAEPMDRSISDQLRPLIIISLRPIERKDQCERRVEMGPYPDRIGEFAKIVLEARGNHRRKQSLDVSLNP